MSQTFDITTVNAPPTTTATITAMYAGVVQSAAFTIVPYPDVSGLNCSTTHPSGGTSIQCTGILTQPAPVAGWTLALSSNDASAIVPATVRVSPSSLTFSFTISTAVVTADLGVVIQITDPLSGAIVFQQALTIGAAS
jgi:hypothetical protein